MPQPAKQKKRKKQTTNKHRRRLGRRKLYAAAAVTAAVTAALGVGLRAYLKSRSPYLAQVAPQLRSWALYLPNHLVPPALMLYIMGLAAKVDLIRASDRDVVIRIIEGKSPDDGHPFSARQLVPRALVQRVPDTPPRPAMIWTHGGGHVVGTPGFYDPQNARIAEELGIFVFAPSYRKSQQAPFPADLDDCYAVVRWVQENAGSLGIDPQRIAVCGDSAGGGLAAGIVQRAEDEGHPVAFQGLVYPMLDHRSATDPTTAAQAMPSSRGQFIWTARLNAAAWQHYLGPSHLSRELAPYASPLYRQDLSQCPPTWIGIGDLDLFYPEAHAFAQRLSKAGVPVTFETYEGAYHGFDHIAPQAAKTKKLHADLIKALREVLLED